MPQRTGDGGNIRPAVYQQGSVQVPESVDAKEPLSGLFAEVHKPMVRRIRIHSPPVPGREEEVIVFPLVPDAEPLFCLHRFVSAKDSTDLRGEAQVSLAFLCFRVREEAPFPFHVFQCTADRNNFVLKINVLPL